MIITVCLPSVVWRLSLSDLCLPQVDGRKVWYIQGPVDSVGWAAMDTMTFSVASPPASLESQTFKFDISYENVGPDRKSLLVANTGKSKKILTKNIIIDNNVSLIDVASVSLYLFSCVIIFLKILTLLYDCSYSV